VARGRLAQLASAGVRAHRRGLRPGHPAPYDLRHSFASLLIHEGRWSIVEIADQLGHGAGLCVSTYAEVMAELRGAERVSAEEEIRRARSLWTAPTEECGPNMAHTAQLSFDDLLLGTTKAPQTRGLWGESRRGDSNPRPHHYE
jgi:hypothetical protein